jgi:ribose 5-phosphate isomerase B
MKSLLNNIFIASDHAGFELKSHMLRFKNEMTDLGPYHNESVDYPDFSEKLCRMLKEQYNAVGVLICGSGIGMSIAANRHPHIRAALCYTQETARLARAHNNANVLVLGAKFVTQAQSLELLNIFLTTPFDGGRHAMRVEKLGRVDN